MRLTYITRVTVPSTAAQSRQVFAMARAFHGVLGTEHFGLIARRGNGADHLDIPFDWDDTPARTENQWMRYAHLLWSAARRVHSNPRDVVFTRDIAVAYAVVLAGGHAVYEAHKEPKGAIARWITRRVARSARFRLVSISSALARYYAEQYGIATERLLPAHDGVFTQRYDALRALGKSELRAKLGLPQNKFVVMHTGSIGAGRGAELFGAIAGSADDICFVQVGGDPEQIAKLVEQMPAGVRSRLQVVSWQPSECMPEYQMAADALLYIITRDSPLFWCCSPLKLFEYMATGVPILGASIGSVAEVLTEENGFCFDPDTSGSLDMALSRLLTDPTEARRRAERALQQVREEYSWGRRAERIVAFARV